MTGPIVARNLRTEAELKQAEAQDRAYLALMRYASLPMTYYGSPKAQWRHHRQYLNEHCPHLSKTTRYTIVRKVMGCRQCDLVDPRQMRLEELL